MLERRFNVFDGDIGSMDESECSRMLNMFHFLEARAEHLRSLRETSEAGWLLEEYFLSHATCQEMRVYYILTVNDFSMAALKKSCVLGNNLRTILISLIKKGLPLFGDLAEYAQSEERLVLNALRERGSLTRELMSVNPPPAEAGGFNRSFCYPPEGRQFCPLGTNFYLPALYGLGSAYSSRRSHSRTKANQRRQGAGDSLGA